MLKKKILIADDHEIFRKGIKQILLDMPDRYDIEEASNGQEVLKKIRKNDFDMVLLDISMPGINGIDTLKQLKNYRPDMNALILSMYPEEQFAVRALKAGAAGYLTKASKHDELVTAMNKVLLGEKYISSSVANRLAIYISSDEKIAPHEALSSREYEVMCMTASGKRVKQIAKELSLSDKTVSTYRSRILNKLKMNNIAQLIQYAINNRIIEQLNK